MTTDEQLAKIRFLAEKALRDVGAEFTTQPGVPEPSTVTFVAIAFDVLVKTLQHEELQKRRLFEDAATVHYPSTVINEDGELE